MKNDKKKIKIIWNYFKTKLLRLTCYRLLHHCNSEGIDCTATQELKERVLEISSRIDNKNRFSLNVLMVDLMSGQ